MAVTALLIWAVVKSSTGEKIQDLTFTQFINEVNKDNVHDVTIVGTDATGTLKQPKENGKFRTTIPSNYPELYKALLEKNVDVKQKDSSGSNWMTWVANGLPMILLLGVWIFMVRQMQSGGNKALSFGKSRARLLSTQQKKVTFKDVAGVDEAKEELHEIIEFLREPQKFQKLGGGNPEGGGPRGPPRKGENPPAGGVGGGGNVPLFFLLG